MKLKNVILTGLCLGMLIGASAQSKPTTEDFSLLTQKFMNALDSKDLDAFVSFYSDSVLYRDPAFGSADYFSRSDLKRIFGAFFSETSGFTLETITVGPDLTRNRLMILLNVIDPKGKKGEYAGWFRFEGGFIVEQIDFFTYAVKDLLNSPRYKKYFKEAKLELKSTEGGN